MRIMGFQKHWINHTTGKPKLSEPWFTTFRFPRADNDWQVEEVVQIVLKPRTKERIILGEARIIRKEPRLVFQISEEEANLDGFGTVQAMRDFLIEDPKYLRGQNPNRLTLTWVRRR